LSFAKSKRITPITMFTNSEFSVAFRNLVLCTDFKEAVFMNKLEQRWFEFKPMVDSKAWIKLLLSIYNWKNHNPLELPSKELI